MKKIILMALALLSSNQAFAADSKPANTQQEIVPAATSRSADCLDDICVGDAVIDSYHSRWAKVEAVSASKNTYSLMSPDGAKFGEYERRFVVSTKEGLCSRGICVNDGVIDTYHNRLAKVVGLTKENSYFLSSPAGQLYGTYEIRLIAITKNLSCLNNYCVGDKVLDTYHNRDAIISGICNSGNYFLSSPGGTLYSCYDSKYIRLTTRAQAIVDESELQNLVQQNIADEGNYRAFRAQGLSHRDALEQASGPAWIGPQSTQKFVLKLSQFVYGFDKNYFDQLGKILSQDEDSDKRNIFVSAALLPMLKNFGYGGLKQKYIDLSSKKIEELLEAYKMNSIIDIESTTLTRRLSLQMLAASLQSEMPQMDASQKDRAAQFLRLIGDALATKVRVRDLENFLRSTDDLQRLLLELAQNPYLQGRTTTDTALLNYLRNS